jgi:hypothetical protein
MEKHFKYNFSELDRNLEFAERGIAIRRSVVNLESGNLAFK